MVVEHRGWEIKTSFKGQWFALITRPGSTFVEDVYPSSTNEEGEQVCIQRAKAHIDSLLTSKA